MNSPKQVIRTRSRLSALGFLCVLPWIAMAFGAGVRPQSDGPVTKPAMKQLRGNARSGQAVFRFETFGNEGFWTDAVRMPQGMANEKVTPLDALKLGLSIDSERVDPDLKRALASELKTDLSIQNAPLLNDPATTVKLINANAIVGVVARDTTGNGNIDIERGDKVGVACALCHSITDASVFNMPRGGTIGRRIDGPTNHFLNVGKILATAANSRALYPTLQLDMGGGKTIGRAPKGLTIHSTEAEVDAYLSNPKYYPVGTFDDTPDGIGNPLHIPPLFRQDLAGPYGSSGQNDKLDDFGNAVYTLLFDMTNLTSPGGRKFLGILAGPAGGKLMDDYEAVLRETGVTGYPYVHVSTTGKPGAPGTPAGVRVDNQKLLDLNAYEMDMPAPKGIATDPAAIARGRELFVQNCTSCHNVDQSKPVPPILIPMKRIWPGYRPTILARRKPPLSPIQNSPGTFDDKMIVVDASPGGGIRGNALPLLLDLARKPVFLHDDSVPSLSALLDPRRGRLSPHPFYFPDRVQRSDMVTFLKSLSAN